MIRGGRSRAFSLVEILVAIGILVLAASFVVSFFSARSGENQKTVNYYQAMFIAGKIIEDLDNAVRENPYFIPELKNLTGKYRVFDPLSPFFISIEDFDSDGRLDDVSADYKDFFDIKKLDNFEYRITLSAVAGCESHTDHIAEARVVVSWNDNGRAKDYSLTTVLAGAPMTPAPTAVDYGVAVDAMKNDVRTALDTTMDVKPFAASLGDDYETLLNLGMLSALSAKLETALREADAETDRLKNLQAKSLSSRIELARSYEKKAAVIMDHMAYIKFPAANIGRLIKNNDFAAEGFATAHPSAMQKIRDRIGMLLKNDTDTGAYLPGSFINRFNEAMTSCFSTYMELLTAPETAGLMSLREKQTVFYKLIDIGRALVLNKSDSMIVTIDGVQLTMRQLVKNCLRNLQKYYERRNQRRADFINAQLERFGDPTKRSESEKALEKKFDDINTVVNIAEFVCQQM